MAMMKLANPLTEIEGKQGGVIWRYDQCGQHQQGFPRLIHRPPTEAQAKIRNCFSNVQEFLVSYLRRNAHIIDLPKTIFDAWTLYAGHYPVKNKKGELRVLSWYQMFMSYNMKRCLAGEPLEIMPLPPD